MLGGPFFGPWDIDNLPMDTIEQILIFEDFGNLKSGFDQVEAKMQELRERYAGK